MTYNTSDPNLRKDQPHRQGKKKNRLAMLAQRNKSLTDKKPPGVIHNQEEVDEEKKRINDIMQGFLSAKTNLREVSSTSSEDEDDASRGHEGVSNSKFDDKNDLTKRKPGRFNSTTILSKIELEGSVNGMTQDEIEHIQKKLTNDPADQRIK